MNIKPALDIEGWMSEAELAWLAEQASRSFLIAEVGSWKGRSTRALADNTTGIIYAVDTWNPEPAEWMDSYTYTKAMLKIQSDIYKAFIANLEPHATNGRVIPIRLSSIDAARSLEHEFDFVFIDAAHDYDNVCADIRAWESKTLVLAGHDYVQSWPGVIRAVDELIPYRVIVPNTSIWVRLQM